MIKRLGIISILFVFLSLKCLVTVQAQELSVYATQESLESVLIRIAPSISFDSHLVRPYRVTLRKDFKDVEEALDYLLRDTPLKYKKAGGIYVIYKPKGKQLTKPKPIVYKPKRYVFQGYVRDVDEKTPMHYASVLGKQIYASCDENGFFSFTSSNPQVKVAIQFVGYQAMDTILNHGQHELSLQLAEHALDEVVVKPSASSLVLQYSDNQDHTLIHRNMMLDLPGTVDNSSWQTLRLMPGVRASGEPLNDPIIWGSTGDESAIYLDGMRLFVSNSMSKQIGVVSPMVIDHINVQKVNHNSRLGNHTGGIVAVSSRTPSKRLRVEGQVSQNMASAYLSVPLGDKFSFSVASRHSFRDMFSNVHLKESKNFGVAQRNKAKKDENSGGNNGKKDNAGSNGQSGKNGNSDTNQSAINPVSDQTKPDHVTRDTILYTVRPDYQYFDIHAGLTGQWGERDQNRLKLYFYSNDEDLDYSIQRVSKDDELNGQGHRSMRQYSGALDYDYQWSSNQVTSFMLSYSEADNTFGIDGITPQEVFVSEAKAVLQHDVHLGNHHFLVDLGVTQYTAKYLENQEKEDLLTTGMRYRWQKGLWSLQVDGQVQYINSRIYFTPQVYVNYRPHRKWKLQVTAAKFHQFLYGVDEDRKENNEWIRVWHLDQSISSTQVTAHALYADDMFLLGQRLIYLNRENTRFFNSVESIDASGDTWGSETYGKIQFPKGYITSNYSVFDLPTSTQLWHEWKSAATWYIGYFTLSSQYIYGHGFELTGNYHRLDSGVNYILPIGPLTCTVGASVMNIFDSENIQSQAYVLQTAGQTPSVMLTEATNRTWMLSAKIIF